MALEQRIDAIGKPERKIKRKRKDEEDVCIVLFSHRSVLTNRSPISTTRKSVIDYANEWNEQQKKTASRMKRVYQLLPNWQCSRMSWRC